MDAGAKKLPTVKRGCFTSIFSPAALKSDRFISFRQDLAASGCWLVVISLPAPSY